MCGNFINPTNRDFGGGFSPIPGILNGDWNQARDSLEATASVLGNYYLPGSSLLTSNLVSDGAQKTLNTPFGTVANIGSGLAGSGIGSSITGIPSAASQGAGWTNAANGIGNLVGAGNIGTDVSNSVSGLLNGGSGSSSGGLLSGLLGNGSSAASSLGGGAALDSGASLAGPGAATLSAGGAGSSFGPLQIGGALLGGYNSLSANDKAQKDLLAAEANAQNAIAPYQASGVAANSKLSDLLGTSNNTGAAGYGSLTTPFTAADLQNTPGYQFQLDQGNQALARQQAAAGNLDSGAAMKAAQQFGQGLASTTYNNAFAQDQANKAQQYGMLSGQAGAGQNAANTSGQISQNIGNAQANNQIASSGILNQTLSSLLSGSGARAIKGYNP